MLRFRRAFCPVGFLVQERHGLPAEQQSGDDGPDRQEHGGIGEDVQCGDGVCGRVVGPGVGGYRAGGQGVEQRRDS